MVRTRFAPSPTGFLHVGGLRTALYNYLYARKTGGTFILRIEDTDQKRYVEGAVEHLLNTLKQVGIDYDEGPQKDGKFGPYIQSQRTELYRKYTQELLDKKVAYRCFCTPERLEEMREKQSANKQAPMYDRTCLNLSEQEIQQKIDAGIPFVVRQKIPHGRNLQFNDLIRGNVTFDTSNIDDQVLMKSDNYPTYHLANVVDDHLMEITHVIRGEEWLPSTPKHILLYEAFGWQPPQFAHIPLLLNKDKTKLSKRQGDVSVESYLEKGFIREAIINFIALLGWHPGEGEEKELFSVQELIEKFSLEKVHKAGAIFDIDKFTWFNYQWQKNNFMDLLSKKATEIDPGVKIEKNEKGEFMFNFSSKEKNDQFVQFRGAELLKKCEKYLPGTYKNDARLTKALITVEDKILKNPMDVETSISFYFNPKPATIELLINEKMKVDMEMVTKAISETAQVLEAQNDFDNQETIKNVLLELVQKLGIKNGQLLWPVRVALTGEQFSPGVFELIWVLGKDETIMRLKQTFSALQKT